jgi:hypothetical protein
LREVVGPLEDCRPHKGRSWNVLPPRSPTFSCRNPEHDCHRSLAPRPPNGRDPGATTHGARR